MTMGIIEPILAGLTVGIINKWNLNNGALWIWCTSSSHSVDHHEDDISSSNTTVSDISLDEIHVPHTYVH